MKKSRFGRLAWNCGFGAYAADDRRKDFDLVEPSFFSTSNVGGSGPKIGNRETGPLQSAMDIAALSKMDSIITCQGGDYTSEIFPQLRKTGWSDTGSTPLNASNERGCDHHSDPVNDHVIRDGLAKGLRIMSGGNCTVSLMLMALHGLFKHDLVEWLTSMTYQAASGAGAQNMRELLKQMGAAHGVAASALADPASAILEIDRQVSATIRSSDFPTENFLESLSWELDPLDRQRS